MADKIDLAVEALTLLPHSDISGIIAECEKERDAAHDVPRTLLYQSMALLAEEALIRKAAGF